MYHLAIRNFPDDYTALLQQVDLALSDGKLNAADEYAQKIISAIKARPSTRADWISRLAWSFVDGHLPAKAEEYFNFAVSSDPENPDLLNTYAWFLIEHNYNIEKGLRMVDKALELKPDDWSMLDVKGLGFYKLGRYEEAMNILEKARALMPYNKKLLQHLEDAKRAVGLLTPDHQKTISYNNIIKGNQ